MCVCVRSLWLKILPMPSMPKHRTRPSPRLTTRSHKMAAMKKQSVATQKGARRRSVVRRVSGKSAREAAPAKKAAMKKVAREAVPAKKAAVKKVAAAPEMTTVTANARGMSRDEYLLTFGDVMEMVQKHNSNLTKEQLLERIRQLEIALDHFENYYSNRLCSSCCSEYHCVPCDGCKVSF